MCFHVRFGDRRSLILLTQEEEVRSKQANFGCLTGHIETKFRRVGPLFASVISRIVGFASLEIRISHRRNPPTSQSSLSTRELKTTTKVCRNSVELSAQDDLRCYAYEGEGASPGSLSSCCSGKRTLKWIYFRRSECLRSACSNGDESSEKLVEGFQEVGKLLNV